MTNSFSDRATVRNDRRMAHESVELARRFVEEKLVPYPQFEAALVTGSFGHGEARDDSDVDMVLVFDPLDVRIVPGEFAWVPGGAEEFHPVVGPAAVEARDVGGVQIDAKRISIADLDSGDLADGTLHELAHALVLFDRTGRVTAVLERRLAYPPERRRSVSFRHRERAWIHQAKATARRRDRWIDRVGPSGAVDVLVGGLEEIVLLVHACNGVHAPFRYRWLLSMEHLDWVPDGYASFRDAVLVPEGDDVRSRLDAACDAFDLVLAQVDDRFRELGWAAHAGEVWADSHRELGFGYNMDDWRRAHRELLAEQQPEPSPGLP
jgi:hypothetical protein